MPDGIGVPNIRDKAVGELGDVGKASQAAGGQAHEHAEWLHLQKANSIAC